MKDLKVMYSKHTDNWKTPSKLYNFFMESGFIDTFPYMSKYDEFEKNYFNENLFINPPYSKLEQVVEWLIKQLENNKCICLLIPARTDTKYFHKLLKYKPSIWFMRGSLKFNDVGSAPFPSLILCFYKYNFIPYYVYGDINEFINKHQYWRKTL